MIRSYVEISRTQQILDILVNSVYNVTSMESCYSSLSQRRLIQLND